MKLKFCKVRDVKSPTRAHSTDAGVDFFIPNDFVPTFIDPGHSVLIPSGIKVDVPVGWALIFENKSGIASKKSLLVGASVVDHGYQGEVHINIHNVGHDSAIIEPGDKIIQGVMYEVGGHMPEETPDDQMWQDTKSARGDGGFGSTGTN